MKIVVLDRFLAKVLYLDVDDAVIENDDVEGWLRRKGYEPKDYPFFRTVARMQGATRQEFHRQRQS